MLLNFDSTFLYEVQLRDNYKKDMRKTPELDYSEIADKLDDIDTSEIFKSLEEVIDAIPGALEKLKSIDGEVEKLEYYIELMAIAQKLDNFREGKEDPN